MVFIHLPPVSFNYDTLEQPSRDPGLFPLPGADSRINRGRARTVLSPEFVICGRAMRAGLWQVPMGLPIATHCKMSMGCDGRFRQDARPKRCQDLGSTIAPVRQALDQQTERILSTVVAPTISSVDERVALNS